MKHIISNPHNGAPVDHLGVKLEPGQEVALYEQKAEELSQRFGFLLLRVVPGKGVNPTAKLKPVKIKGTLVWNTEVDPSPDVADFAVHAHSSKSAAPKKKVGKKKGK